uniref:Fe2OG dioxygenase domain-containing protein n=1 Tax=Parastrongyloides trichosuri TaxID=131310 RepID=A0A0N4ZYN5_PARTI
MKRLSSIERTVETKKSHNLDVKNGYDVIDERNVKSMIRQHFKYYKNDSMNPDFSNVHDLGVSNIEKGIYCNPIKMNDKFEKYINILGLTNTSHWTCTTMINRPGLYIIKGMFSQVKQMEWINNCLLVYPENGAITNLNSNGQYTGDNVFRTNGKKLRWVTKGYDYNWTTKEYPKEQTSHFPKEFSLIFELVSLILNFNETHADTAIINYYPRKSTLSVHSDHSERRLDKPLISLSFGQSAIFLLGGESEDDENVDALLLSTGDIMVMHEKQRLAYHAVPRIMKTTKFEEKDHKNIEKDVLEYSNNNRVNITLRQCD